jgi:DNA-binding transcriptional LysR family regulator
MRAFVAVADAGQFSGASERLGLSRAMASKQVMDLEAHLGLRLLNRTTRRVGLTDEGAGYLERCRDILSAIDEAEQEFASRALEPSGRLRVTAPMSFGASHLAPQIALYAARNPRVSVELILNDRHVDLVEEGFDFAIRIGRLADSSLVAKKIGEVRLIACAAPSYLSARGRPQTPSDLADHECVLYSYASAGAVWNFTGPAGRESVRVGGRVVCNNGEAISNIAIAGLGVIAQPDFIVAGHLATGALERVLASYVMEPTGIYAIHTSRRYVPLKIRSLIDQLSAAFADTKVAPAEFFAESEVR